ncbi:TetR family transcriptional regulator [Microvirgula aerodenitrificans]|uniref:TetR family transcriptional regulator n=1 Tax=Microvirgula aerodenitrificans TaxID=57480 RepID=UPI0028E68812|nr:TetR family transcriptional regulator [Microvirgula aerodenitrificans]
MRRTKEDAALTRESLLDAAERLFSEKGVSRTSLADIASAAGVTRGAIYWHFKNKAEVFVAMHARLREPVDAVFQKLIVAGSGDPIRRVRDYYVYVLEETTRSERRRRLLDILTHKAEYVDELKPAIDDIHGVHKRVSEAIAQIFVEAKAVGVLRADVDPELAAETLRFTVHGALSIWLLWPERYPLAERAGPLIDQILNGILVKPLND